MTPDVFRRLALALPHSHEEPHFERASFRVGKRIFATLSPDGREAMIPVHPVERCLTMLASDPKRFIDHGGWTRRLGALGLRLRLVDARLVEELLREAWSRLAERPPGRGRRKPSKPSG